MRAIGHGIAAFLCLAMAQPATADPRIERDVVRAVQQVRDRADVARLERRRALDRVARIHARRLAEMPHERRLRVKGPGRSDLSEHGVAAVREALLHVDLRKGYGDYADTFISGWRAYETSWRRVGDENFDAIGLAVHAASDGWVILVALLVDDARVKDGVRLNPKKLEQQTVAAVNAVRVEHGLTPLVTRGELTRVARGHSEHMRRGRFFDHRSPDGLRPADRVRRRGIEFLMLGENIQMSRNMDDPVAVAVESWLESKGHRDTMLTPEYRETGVGVTVDEDGSIWFTQLFLLSR